MQLGTTKDQGLYNKPLGCSASGGISRQDPTTIQVLHPQKTTGKIVPNRLSNGTNRRRSRKISRLILAVLNAIPC